MSILTSGMKVSLGGCDGPESIFLFGECAGPVKCQNMSSYQKDVKLSKRCEMSKIQTSRLWKRFTKKIINGIIGFTHIDVNFDVKYEGH